MTLQTTHNTTAASLQRELDTLRQEHQVLKIQLRELEMGNDDLERNERAVSSSLADVEAKYSRTLEEKILLEHELLTKANLEEESQRLKDELRGEKHLAAFLHWLNVCSSDANVEISILKDQLAAQASAAAPTSAAVVRPLDPPPVPRRYPSSDENLLRTTPPDMQLSDLVQDSDDLLSVLETPRRPPSKTTTLLPFKPNKSNAAQPKIANTPALPRSNTLPSTQLALPSPRLSATRALVGLGSSSNTTAGSVVIASKSKGVQMVSEMRARVRNLEQKIHTRVPRLRMGSLTGRPNANALAQSSIPSPSSISSSSSKAPAKSSLDGRSSRSSLLRQSFDIESDRRKSPAFDTSGWVLIMEDSSPEQDSISKARRRPSSPTTRGAFRPAASTSSALPKLRNTNNKSNILAQSTMNPAARRPQSRLSVASTATASSSVHTPSSRPSTPTFLPLPTSGSYSSGLVGLKRSTGPGSTPYAQAKRSSLGSQSPVPPMPALDGIIGRERPLTMPPAPIRPSPSSRSTISRTSKSESDFEDKALPTLPLHANVTIRPSSKLSAVNPLLSQSRIGRPSSSSGRRSAGGEDGGYLDSTATSRPRSGSANTGYTRNGT